MPCQFIKSRIILLVVTILFVPVLSAKSATELTLTSNQRSWLKAHPVIRLASDNAWPPFEWVNKDM